MEKMKYQISSRATILLGRESVSKANGAIIELVKNTYDADADLCFLYFDGNNIYLLDNGVGMTQEIVQDNWMLIGTDNKKNDYISMKKRIKSGEKGIGRFALDRLGSTCEMYTKNINTNYLFHWKTDWKDFEVSGKKLEEIEASYEKISDPFIEAIPIQMREVIEDYQTKIRSDDKKKYEESIIDLSLTHGTLLKIGNLRDIWTEDDIEELFSDMSFLIPPTEQDNYVILLKSNFSKTYEVVENLVSKDFDYKIHVDFDKGMFKVSLYRNEYDVDTIPNELFKDSFFSEFPYRKIDFENKEINYLYSPKRLMKIKDPDTERIIEKTINDLGSFSFDYMFMKANMNKQDKERFYYREIGKNRKNWLDNYSGIKIYRDNFLVRPYGDMNSESFDWLGLDKKAVSNPTSVANQTGRWSVRNKQGQGTLFISRIANGVISDKSSREGLIDNYHFQVLKRVVLKLINLFEKDRSAIAFNFKKYYDKINEKETTKELGTTIANRVLNTPQSDENISSEETTKKIETLAKAVKVYEEEREELISDNQTLRSLATNGLITTSIIHDLKSIQANLVTREKDIRTAVHHKDEKLLDRQLRMLGKNDMYLKSWISVITEQAKTDKRKRKKLNIGSTIESIISLIKPIMDQKKVDIIFTNSKEPLNTFIFFTDFESIIYNLIINSIEAVESYRNTEKDKIEIILINQEENYIIKYFDNGPGLSKSYSNPKEILNFGETTKKDINGENIGNGLGMYIVATTVREYNGDIVFPQTENGFSIDLIIPKDRRN